MSIFYRFIDLIYVFKFRGSFFNLQHVFSFLLLFFSLSFSLSFFFSSSCFLGFSPLLATDTLHKIKQKSTLTIGLEIGSIPFSMIDKKGRPIGLDIDLAKMLARDLGVKAKFINTEWDGLIPALLTRKFDLIISAMTITAKRNTQVIFSKPYLEMGQTLIYNKRHQSEIKSIFDFNQKKYTLASKMGTTGEKAIKKYFPKANYKAYEDIQNAAMEVIHNRVDALVYDLAFNSLFSKTRGKDKIINTKTPFTYEPFGICLRKDEVNLLNLINNFIEQIKGDGRLEQLKKKWLTNTKWVSNVK